MSGIQHLEEKHKRCVELVIRGVPRHVIAEELGISRTTVYSWLNDPLVQAYYQKLADEMEAARRQRLTALFQKTADVYEAGLTETLRLLNSDDPADRQKAPPIQVLASIFKTVHQMERTDYGEPTHISETRTTTDPAAPKQRTKLEKYLDGVVVDEGPVTLEIEAKT